MSDDTTRIVDPARPSGAFEISPAGEHLPGRFDNPMIKGLLVLVMLAVATTVLVATDDGEESTVVAADALASQPLGPDTVDPAPTPSSVQEVASNVASSDTEPWIDDGSTALEYSSAIEDLRHQGLKDDATTTTEPPTTTIPPTTAAPATTAAPTTAAPTTAAPATEATTAEESEAESTTSTSGDDTAESTTTEGSETTAPETTEAPPTTTAPESTTTTASADGWVDTGNGVLVPPVLLAIRWCESRDDYQAANPSSSARGAYQFLTGSWAAYGHADRYGVNQAHLASKVQQDEAALLTWQRDGTRPWNASRTCWSKRI